MLQYQEEFIKKLEKNIKKIKNKMNKRDWEEIIQQLKKEQEQFFNLRIKNEQERRNTNYKRAN